MYFFPSFFLLIYKTFMDKVVELVGGGSVINGLTLSSSLLNVKKR